MKLWGYCLKAGQNLVLLKYSIRSFLITEDEKITLMKFHLGDLGHYNASDDVKLWHSLKEVGWLCTEKEKCLRVTKDHFSITTLASISATSGMLIF